MISPSKYGYESTVSRLESLLEQNEALSLFTKIKYSKNAEKASLELSEVRILIFGNPKQGALLMQSDQLSGVDLRHKMLVYKDKNKAKVIYSSINYLKSRYQFKAVKNLPEMKKYLKTIASKVLGRKS
ncbi:DUF302 domain-containing protein [Salegentibacter salegens]|uniref:DUF302 domain-containing protein n=1 Tax=Salegentibacter salegens TaxID=143223 RepID=A0A1M7IBD0_9FLAO|nr:DUF302 domain-containing protein [Salegentibacter salegens]PRX48014.1 uncharacterized protein DUF302 [Salegentibacter salegens]SHM37888.1 protein of unknown function DUF302 [Salegentibacter salegens]